MTSPCASTQPPKAASPAWERRREGELWTRFWLALALAGLVIFGLPL